MSPDTNTHPGSSAMPATDPMLASALAGIEQGLGQIRRMSREADELKLRLETQQVELTRREGELVERMTGLQADAVQLETDRRALTQDRERLDQDRKALEELAGAAERRTGEIARMSDELEARKHSLDQREHAISEQESALAARRGELEARATELAERRREVDARAQTLAETERTLADREKAAADALAKAEQVRTETTRRGEELRVVEERAKRDQNELGQLRQNLTAAHQQTSQTIKALQEATARAERAEQTALDLRGELDALSSRSGESAAAVRERDELRQASEELRAKLRGAEEHEARLAAAVQALKEQSEAASRQRDELQANLTRAKATTTGAPDGGAELASARAKLAESEAARTKALETLASREKELTDARLIIDDLRGQLAQQEKDAKELEGVLEQLRERLRTEAAKTEAFAAQAQSLEARVSELASRPAPAGAPAAVHAGGPGESRLRRIGLVRKLVREKTKKIRRVSEALGKRYEQCEQVLTLRQEVLAAKRSVEAVFKKQQSTEARSRAVQSTFFLTCAAAMMAGIAWLLAGQVAPETFVAKAVLAADNSERQLGGGELEEWSKWHRELLDDPRFHDFAAQKLSRQAIAGWTTPSAVKDRIKGSLQVTNNKPGEMTMELKGVGREKLERELQALAIAVQSSSREARERRVDGANTNITQPAKAGAEPIESVRLVYTGAIFGGEALIFGILGAMVWNRLRQAKMKFDQSQAVEATEDEGRWPALERHAA